MNETVLIVPRGVFPHPLGEQVLDMAALVRLVGRMRRAGRDLVVDYRHESLDPSVRAEAAGWVRWESARIVPDGVAARIDWTAAAARLVDDKKYRFLSPVFEMRDGRITGLYNLGLTNNPNIDAMPPLVNQRIAKETRMDEELRAAVKEALGLAPDADDALAAEAFAALFPAAAPEEEPTDEPDGDEAEPLAARLGEETLAALGLTLAAADATVIEKIAALSGEAATVRTGAAERAVNDAIAAGRLTPGLKGWALGLAARNPEALATYLVNAGPAVPLGGIVTPRPAAPSSAPVGDREAAVCRALNITSDDYRRYGG
jgi:phage I-like protein